MLSSSCRESESSAPVLSFAPPEEIEVRKQLFGTMLCDQLEATNSVARTKESRKRKIARVPDYASQWCQGPNIKKDPLLRLALFSDADTDKEISQSCKIICDYVRRTSSDMPSYMRDAYAALAKTEDHILQIAAIYFFVYWHVDYDYDTDICTLKKSDDAKARQLLRQLGFKNNQSAMLCLHRACTNFEHGRDDVSTMMSFVHTLVCRRWKKIATVPHSSGGGGGGGAAAKAKRQRRLASSSSASATSKSLSSSSLDSSSSSSSSAHHSSSSERSLMSSSDGLRNTSTMSSASHPSL